MWPSNMGVTCNEGKSGDELRSQAPQKKPWEPEDLGEVHRTLGTRFC